MAYVTNVVLALGLRIVVAVVTVVAIGARCRGHRHLRLEDQPRRGEQQRQDEQPGSHPPILAKFPG